MLSYPSGSNNEFPYSLRDKTWDSLPEHTYRQLIRATWPTWYRRCDIPVSQQPIFAVQVRMSSPQDYTVGWVCAIRTEYVAAQAFLDETHDRPEYVSTSDNNDYTLGKIGRHNVVLAVLPHGEYGTSSAAAVARDMLHTFPNVRFGLMVGIGGGAPRLPDYDIRLGDVVVGTAVKGKTGVLQYDFGRAKQGQHFQTTGFLNQAPEILRTAINGLESQYELEGNQIEERINSTLAKRPRIRKKYKRPNQDKDRLYQAEFIHPSNDDSPCAAVCGTGLVSRRQRPEDEDSPAIHYGRIASANTLMVDAILRDRLASEENILCFEMEAAGLINHFPCLVIRGICDYSDTHKNKEWQGYAAMSAAAYARDLLYRIVPNKVEAEVRISELLKNGQFSQPLIIMCESVNSRMKFTMIYMKLKELSHVSILS